MKKQIITVVGGTGAQGGGVVNALLTSGQFAVRVVSRNPDSKSADALKKRGAAYAGAVGYFAADGSMDTCIVLRTALVKDGTMYVQAGGGIVADSQPEAEYQETISKSKALLAAAEEAVRFASAAKRGQ